MCHDDAAWQRVWRDCQRKNVHTFCKGCCALTAIRGAAFCPQCHPSHTNRIGLQGGVYTAVYEPYGHVQHLLHTEEKDRKEKEDIAMQLIQEEEAAKRAAEKKKKKKKKKAQVRRRVRHGV